MEPRRDTDQRRRRAGREEDDGREKMDGARGRAREKESGK